MVALGDSAISGEAGRWAGNTNGASSRTDALGSSAYNDIPGAESIPGCHRSKSAEVHIGGGVTSVNLACSGARTYSRVSDGKFKPGIDFYASGANKGQALALQEYARDPGDVKTVVVLIGANDYGFADIVQTCVTDWLTSPSWWKNYCQDDSSMTAMFSQANINANTTAVRNAFSNVKLAMQRAGYAPTSVQAARADLLRAAADVLGLPLRRDRLHAPDGRRLRRLEQRRQLGAQHGREHAQQHRQQRRRAAWRRAGAGHGQRAQRPQAVREHGRAARGEGRRDLAERRRGGQERVGHQIRTLTTLFPPYQLQEDAHPNYWGQLALRNCFRQAYNGGASRGGSCTYDTTGLNAQGEPKMKLTVPAP